MDAVLVVIVRLEIVKQHRIVEEMYSDLIAHLSEFLVVKADIVELLLLCRSVLGYGENRVNVDLCIRERLLEL